MSDTVTALNSEDFTPVDVDALEKKITSSEAQVAVIGLGYVGLPLIAALHSKGFDIVGFDIDEKRVEDLNKGISPIKHIESDKIKEFVDSGKFEATASFDRLENADAIIICVPTPLTKQREPDLSYVI